LHRQGWEREGVSDFVLVGIDVFSQTLEIASRAQAKI
jgi:hypothetical protein